MEISKTRLRIRKASLNIYYLRVFVVILFVCCVAVVTFFWSASDLVDQNQKRFPKDLSSNEVILISSETNISQRDTRCTFHSCVEVYHCGYNDHPMITVYIYPFRHYHDENGNILHLHRSVEFDEILQAIIDSPFYSNDPETACLYVPSIDILNQNRINVKETSKILFSLPYWNGGSNHLIFNMLPGSSPDYSTVVEVASGRAVIAGAGFSTLSYRHTFDVSIPIYNPLISHISLPFKSYLEKRSWLVVSSQIGLHPEYRNILFELAEEDSAVLVTDKCQTDEAGLNITKRCRQTEVYSYPQILQDSTFCLVIRGARLGQPTFVDVLKAGCIPVVVADGYVLPFSEVLDWKRASVVLREDELAELVNIIKSFSMERVYHMRQHVKFFWDNYFSSMKAVTLTTLQVINDRVFPFAAKSYEDWNDIPNRNVVKNPLFLPLIPPKSQGFTAVILTYDRLESLFDVIRQVAKVPSLAKVVVVWNNQNKAPPPMSSWPYIGKPVKVVRTNKNKLSNRFFPYDEIETECILALDDDIVMLTADELEFGYEVWREFPDRLVGFPSRLHMWDNVTQKWRYESEWTNAISMVLTGAAFYHKYFSYLYTNSMPGNMKSWVDEHMNCEDIAMNFLIANVTGKAPVKVTPRKKFKCPQCINNEMLSADLTHMVERSECINQFMSIYSSMPLKSVEFRADPVLYKDDFPSILKKFNDIGSL